MSREKRWLELKSKLKNAVFLEIVFWIVVIFSVVTVGYGIFYYKFIKPNLYTIVFSDIDGIIEGSPVRFMGLVSGHVRKLTYHKDYIEVQIIVTKKNMKIPKGSVAAVEFSGIAGSKSIEIMPPKDNLSDIGIISKDTLRLTDLFDGYAYIGKVFASLKDFVDTINQDTVLKVFSAVSSASTSVDKADKQLDDSKIKCEEFTKNMQNVIESEKKLENTLDRANRNAKKIGSYLKN